MDRRHLLITGLPGTGKTTLLVRLAHALADLRPAGFYTEEIRVNGVREGFRLVSLDGREGILSRVDFRGTHRVGRYGVDIKGFEHHRSESGINCFLSRRGGTFCRRLAIYPYFPRRGT